MLITLTFGSNLSSKELQKLELQKLLNKLVLKDTGASWKQKTISRDNHEQNIWGKF